MRTIIPATLFALFWQPAAAVAGLGDFPDISGDGVPDFALPSQTRVNTVEIYSGVDGSSLNSLKFFNSNWSLNDYAAYNDGNRDSSHTDPALAALATADTTGQIKVQLRYVLTGSLVRSPNITFFNSNWAARAVSVHDDPNADGDTSDAAVAVLATHSLSGRNMVELRAIADGSRIGKWAFFTPDWVVRAVAGVVYAGNAYVIVLGTNPNTGQSKAQLRRISDGARSGMYLSGPSVVAEDLIAIKDVNGDGVENDPGLLVVGRRENGNKVMHLRRLADGTKVSYPDSDFDGAIDVFDAFPDDPGEFSDVDHDGNGDNADAFPLDPSEWDDADADGVGNNSDAFPLDPTEHQTSCIRIVKNLLPFGLEDFSLWNDYGDPAINADDSNDIRFEVSEAAGYRTYIEKWVWLDANKTYAITVDVDNFSGAFGRDNIGLRSAAPSDFQGSTSLIFTGNGTHSMIFTYLGASKPFLLRMGIGFDGPDYAADANSVAGFNLAKIMLEELSAGQNVPSEYVVPGRAWSFNFDNLSNYDSRSGLVSYRAGDECGRYYEGVWAVTGDSFADGPIDFPAQLVKISQDFAFYVDAVPGRRLSTATLDVANLLDLSDFPAGLAAPRGLIAEGGVNDVVQGSQLDDLTASALSIVEQALGRDIPVVFVSITPFGSSPYWSVEKEQVRVAYNSWLRELVQQSPGVYLYDAALAVSSGGVADDENPVYMDSGLVTADGLHPSQTGQQVIAAELLKVLNALRN